MEIKWMQTIFIGILFLGLFFGFFIKVSNSQDNYYQISITDKSYEIKSIDEKYEIIYFDISITLKNSGNIISEDMTLRIRDVDGNYTLNGTIMPGESKTFTFEKHPIIGLKDHTISIYFNPTDEFAPLNDFNQGKDELTLKYSSNGNGSSTPGFELIFIIISIMLCFTTAKYKRKLK